MSGCGAKNVSGTFECWWWSISFGVVGRVVFSVLWFIFSCSVVSSMVWLGLSLLGVGGVDVSCVGVMCLCRVGTYMCRSTRYLKCVPF